MQQATGVAPDAAICERVLALKNIVAKNVLHLKSAEQSEGSDVSQFSPIQDQSDRSVDQFNHLPQLKLAIVQNWSHFRFISFGRRFG